MCCTNKCGLVNCETADDASVSMFCADVSAFVRWQVFSDADVSTFCAVNFVGTSFKMDIESVYVMKCVHKHHAALPALVYV